MIKKEIDKALKSGIGFLHAENKKDTYFGFKTIFPAILVFDCLNEVKGEKSCVIKNNLATALLKEKSNFFSFNYWQRESEKYIREPYPDDLDDTMCALSAIYRFNKDCLSGESLAKIVNLLVLAEEDEGGPYRTWILPKEKSQKWNDIDLAVNSNIGYFLKLQDVKLKKISNLVSERIKNNNIKSPYYKDELPIIYFISRFYRGKYSSKLKEKLLNYIESPNSTLNLALTISSLIRFGWGDLIDRNHIHTLLYDQGELGNWKSDGFYYYKTPDNSSEYVGSDSLSTAFIIEALALYKNFNKEKKKLVVQKQFDNLKEKLILRMDKCFVNLEPHYKSKVIEQIVDVLAQDKSNNILIPLLNVVKSLGKDNKKKIQEELVVELCLFSVIGWTAFTLYDQIIDEDKSPKELPKINILMRELSKIAISLPIKKETGFLEYFYKVMDGMDLANWKELCVLRNKSQLIPEKFDWELLSDRSMGHALASIAIFCYLEKPIDSDEVQNLINYFKYFIKAKQMNDDAHDWQNDLEKNQIDSANYLLLDLMNKRGQKGLTTDEQKIIFWEEVIPNYCKKIILYSQKANGCIKNTILIKTPSALIKMNNKNIRVAKKTIEERNNILQFIKKYYNK